MVYDERDILNCFDDDFSFVVVSHRIETSSFSRVRAALLLFVSLTASCSTPRVSSNYPRNWPSTRRYIGYCVESFVARSKVQGRQDYLANMA